MRKFDAGQVSLIVIGIVVIAVWLALKPSEYPRKIAEGKVTLSEIPTEDRSPSVYRAWVRKYPHTIADVPAEMVDESVIQAGIDTHWFNEPELRRFIILASRFDVMTEDQYDRLVSRHPDMLRYMPVRLWTNYHLQRSIAYSPREGLLAIQKATESGAGIVESVPTETIRRAAEKVEDYAEILPPQVLERLRLPDERCGPTIDFTSSSPTVTVPVGCEDRVHVFAVP